MTAAINLIRCWSGGWIGHRRSTFIALRIFLLMPNRTPFIRSCAIALVALSVSTVFAQPAPAAREYKYKTPKLDRAQVDALLAKPEKLFIIDLRRPDELTKIGGFPAYFSVQSADLPNRLALIPKDREILTLSNHAGRAGAAGDLLSSKGFKVAGAAGVQNYEEEGGTLTRIAPPAPKPADTTAAK
jgi:rhodanese-related sulfurtransferase